jgi:alternate signal-mediated exported protein
MMNKLTKGAVAAVLAAGLLVGGTQTIAYWTDEEAVDGGTINAGALSLEPGVTPGTWTDTVNATVIPSIAAFLVVPGDNLVYEATFVVNAEGDNLGATLQVDDASITGDLLTESTITVTVLDSLGAPLPTITEANDGETITAQVEFDFPFASATNASQTDSVDLSGLVLDLVQTPA